MEDQKVYNKSKFSSGRYFACVMATLTACIITIMATYGAIVLKTPGTMNIIALFFQTWAMIMAFYFGLKTRSSESQKKNSENHGS